MLGSVEYESQTRTYDENSERSVRVGEVLYSITLVISVVDEIGTEKSNIRLESFVRRPTLR